MIDSNSGLNSLEENVQFSAEKVKTPIDQYTFIDEPVGDFVKFPKDESSCRKGIKRTFEDLVKYDSCVTTFSNSNDHTIHNSDEKKDSLGKCEIDSSSVSSENTAKLVSEDENELSTSKCDSNLENQWAEISSSWTTSNQDSDNSEVNISVHKNYCNSTTIPRGRGSGRRGRAYGLRPRTNLRRSLGDRESPERLGRKPNRRGRGRGNNLSKYRRNTANARERDRMREINTAFATLRGALPTFACRRISSMTKITTLKLATSYISALADLLKDPPQEQHANIQIFTKEPTECPSTSSSDVAQQGQPSHCSRTENQEIAGTVSASNMIEGHFTWCMEGYDAEGKYQDYSESSIKGRIDDKWWNTLDNNEFQIIDNEIGFDELAMTDGCWTID